MGERHGDGGISDRRVARPVSGGPRPGDTSAAGPSNTPTLESLIADAIRVDFLDPAAEERALAAFRAARDAAADGARTRRRDDWRPRSERWGGRSLRATLAGLLVSATLGGVAIAAIGSVGTSDDGGDGQEVPQPTSSAPHRSPSDTGSTAGPGSSAPGPRDGFTGGPSVRPSPAEDTEARCRAYESVKNRGGALDAAAWQRLVEAAGGEEHVEEYCAGHTGQPTADPGGADSRSRKNDGPAATAKPSESVEIPAVTKSVEPPAVPDKDAAKGVAR
jgi:hypothetical protein